MNIRNKVFLLFVFMFAFFAVNIDEVYAANESYKAECVYKGTTYGDFLDKDIIIKVQVSSSDNSLMMDAYPDDWFANTEIFNGATLTSLPKLFFVYDDVLYCPESVYLRDVTPCQGGVGEICTDNNTYNSQAGLVFFNTDSFIPAPRGVMRQYYFLEKPDSRTVLFKKENNQYTSGNAKFYTPLGDENGFSPCKTNEQYLLDFIDKFIELELKNMPDDKKTLDYLNERINDVNFILESAKNYCTADKVADDLSAKANEALKLIAEIANGANLSSEELEQIMNNTGIVSQSVNQFIAGLQNIQIPFGENEISCDGLIDDSLEAVIQTVLKWVRIAAPILLIVLSALDFSQVVISNDQDAMKKAVSKVVKRAIAALALFFIPLLVSVMLDWIDDSPFFNKNNANCSEVLK